MQESVKQFDSSSLHAQEFLTNFVSLFFCRLIIMEYQTLAVLARASAVAGLGAAPLTIVEAII
jgi:hypothetical protein